MGTPGDLTYLKSSINQQGKGVVVAHAAECNLGRTQDGVKCGGERLSEEVSKVLRKREEKEREQSKGFL